MGSHTGTGTALAPIDWPTVTRLLMEKAKSPVLVVDASGRIRLASPAAEHALGWTGTTPAGWRRRADVLRGPAA